MNKKSSHLFFVDRYDWFMKNCSIHNQFALFLSVGIFFARDQTLFFEYNEFKY